VKRPFQNLIQEEFCVLKREIVILNKLGLHARAAAKFVTLASRFASDIRLRRGEKQANGKSIMGVMMLAASQGALLEIIAVGEDAELALDLLEDLVRQRFGEEE
jgi:phosphocarrier protein